MSAIRRAGVCGWPVAHSRSPLIHGYWLARYHLEGAYERFAVPPLGFAEFAASIGVDGLVGANVTVPHKEAAFAACDRLTESARATGAVNTLWREGGALWGDNTDVAGFLASLDAEAPGWRDRVDSAVVATMRLRLPSVSETRKRRARSEGRRVGKECVRLCRSRWSPYH